MLNLLLMVLIMKPIILQAGQYLDCLKRTLWNEWFGMSFLAKTFFGNFMIFSKFS